MDNIKTPSAKQYDLAWRIAHNLNEEMPRAFTSWAFSDFISTYKEEFDKIQIRFQNDKQDVLMNEIIQNAQKYAETGYID